MPTNDESPELGSSPKGGSSKVLEMPRKGPPSPARAGPPERFGELLPVCPGCGQDPARVCSAPFEMTFTNGHRLGLLTLFCANPACRKIFTIFPVGMAEPEPSRLVVPGRA